MHLMFYCEEKSTAFSSSICDALGNERNTTNFPSLVDFSFEHFATGFPFSNFPWFCICICKLHGKTSGKYSLHLVCSSYSHHAIFVVNRYNRFCCIRKICTVERFPIQQSIVPLYIRANHGIRILHLSERKTDIESTNTKIEFKKLIIIK